MKEKTLKILLYVSFLPYIFILVISIWSIFNGFTFMVGTTYGFKAFYESAIIYGFILCTEIPIIPICVFYEIFYLLRYIMNKKNKKIKENKDEE